MNASLIVLGGVAVLLALMGVQEWRIDNLKTENAEYRVLKGEWETADKLNQQAIKDCADAAAFNILQAHEQKRLAEIAADRYQKRAAELEGKMEAVNGQADVLREELVGDCPVASDPLFIDFLCSGPIGCENA